MAVTAFAALAVGVVDAANVERIEPELTGPVVSFGGSVAQSFSPKTSGVVRQVAVWSPRAESGQSADLLVHAGDRPGRAIGRTSFVWDGNPTTVTLDAPVSVVAGEVYALELSGVVPGVIFGHEDPYADGEFAFDTPTGWMTWSEWLDLCNGCLPFTLDQRFSLEVLPNDADGDGVLDPDDLCAGTVLPDPSVDLLRRGRYAATVDGIVGSDGTVVATLADTGGCSTAQIVVAYGLGVGHLRFGLTRPHVERWIADAVAP
jgi:hypothetical protein